MKRGQKNKPTLGIDNEPTFFTGFRALAESGGKYLVVGGVAANLHGYSGSTKDIDVLIPKDLANTEKILRGLDNLTFGISREILAEEVIQKPFTIIGDTPRVDLLLTAGKLKFDEAYPNRKVVTIEGIDIPYVSLDDLIKSKQTGRAKDLLFIQEIKKIKKLES